MDDLLREWELENLIPTFTENGVTLEALTLIFERNDHESIRQLIPQVSYQAILRKRFENHLESLNKQNESRIDKSDIFNLELTVLSENNTEQKNCVQFPEEIFILNTDGELKSVTSEPILSPSTSAESGSSEYQPQSMKRKLTDSVQDLDIKKILEANCYGEVVLKFYEKNKYLKPRYQKYLVDVLITYLITNRRLYGYLTNTSWDILSDKIIELFPLEEKSSYYVPPVKKSDSKTNKSGIARGKLPDKYKNELCLLREAGVLPKMKSRADTDSFDDLCDTDEELSDSNTSSKIWLETHAEPLEEVLRHWTQTSGYRRIQLQNSKFTTISSILQEWPILKYSFGYILIEKDFELAFPEKVTCFYTKFSKLFDATLDLKRKSIENTDNEILVDLLGSDLTADSRTLLEVYLLCSLVCNKSPKSKKWKPSISESREGIVLQVKTPDQIENGIDIKIAKAKKYGLTLQPFVIVEASSITNVTSSYTYVDGVLYKTKSLLQALDVCFKSFIIFNASYPPECEHIWYLIQIFIYEITTKFDNKIPYILDFVKLLKRS